MATIEIQVPDIGDFDEVAVIELLVKPGDTVKAEQSLITVESDKASMEIPSCHAGVVKALQVKLGDKVKEGSVVLLLESADAAAAPSAAPTAPASVPNTAPAPVAIAQAAPVSVADSASSGPVQRHRSRYWRLQGRGRDRAAGEGGRHRQGGAKPDHRGKRQGLHGNPLQPRRCGQGNQGQAG
jgi:pyruvate/2-oxoglutarate dehydrogenase complex dihydrolipoamide acyltransferase (E2) component